MENRGVECIIAGAGLAAHLPGVIASHTVLPVIGVPIKAATWRVLTHYFQLFKCQKLFLLLQWESITAIMLEC